MVADLPHFNHTIPFNLSPTNDFKPDLILYKHDDDDGGKEVVIVELTVPLTSNVDKRHQEKMLKYTKWLEREESKLSKFTVIAFEVASETGFVSKSLSELFDKLKVPAQKKIRSDIMLDLTVEAIRGSAKIVRSRNNRHFET
jgi:pantoate kinase